MHDSPLGVRSIIVRLLEGQPQHLFPPSQSLVACCCSCCRKYYCCNVFLCLYVFVGLRRWVRLPLLPLLVLWRLLCWCFPIQVPFHGRRVGHHPLLSPRSACPSLILGVCFSHHKRSPFFCESIPVNIFLSLRYSRSNQTAGLFRGYTHVLT